MPEMLPELQAQHLRGGSRPEYYDFNLFNFTDTSIDLDRKLAELAYSVFDSETTGLEPSAGDEIMAPCRTRRAPTASRAARRKGASRPRSRG
jgi:DNA polymerase-3 subunit epsilon